LERLTDFNQVPDYLLEQVKDRNWSPTTLKNWGKAIGANPFNFIIGIKAGEKIIGIFWGTLNPIVEGIFINIVSVDKEYQDGKVTDRAVAFFRDIVKSTGFSKIYALTSRVRAASRYGWKPTNLVLMEVK
jgi:hypothetical protein